MFNKNIQFMTYMIFSIVNAPILTNIITKLNNSFDINDYNYFYRSCARGGTASSRAYAWAARMILYDII